MTRNGVLERDLGAWFDDEARSPIPVDVLDRALAATASRRPRPRRLAWLGSHWAPAHGSRAGVGALNAHGLRTSWAILLLLVALALVGAALLVGSRLVAPPEAAGQLAYAVDGDIYLAAGDGGNPRLVADGGPGTDASFRLIDGTIWAPDGRHLLYYDDLGSFAHVADADGIRVGTFPSPGLHLSWSPDSSRLAEWPTDGPGVRFHGLDGAEHAPLPLPEGYIAHSQFGATWAPDARSLYVPITQPNVIASPEVWRLMTDGSPPQRVAADSPLSHPNPTFTRDGALVALAGAFPTEADRVMHLANADGTDLRPAVTEEQAGELLLGSEGQPRWSPTGAHVAYLVPLGGEPLAFDLRVVDVATGTAVTVVSALQHDDLPSHGWSGSGDAILFSMPDPGGSPALWSVSSVGGDPTLLVSGTAIGEWQPDGPDPAAPTSNDLEGRSQPGGAVAPASPPPTGTVAPESPSPTVPVGPAPSFDPAHPIVPDTALEYAVTLPVGWEHRASGLIAGTGDREGAAVRIGSVGNPDTHLCGNAMLNPTVHSTVEALAQALFDVVEGNATVPASATVGGVDAMYLEFLVGYWTCQPEGGLWADSPNGVFWGDPGGSMGPFQGDTVWILEVEGHRVVIRATGTRYLELDAVEAAAEQARIIESIRFELRP